MTVNIYCHKDNIISSFILIFLPLPFYWAEKQFNTLFPNKIDTFELQGFLA